MWMLLYLDMNIWIACYPMIRHSIKDISDEGLYRILHGRPA